MITALAGGVGAARFLTGLLKLVKEEELTVIVNTGDDINLFGLHISPDIDIVTYTLAGIVNNEKGWGINADTFNCLNMLKQFNQESWFNLGDKDFATSILRTNMLKNGATLSQITAKVACDLGLKLKILPMTNDKFATHIRTPQGSIHFEEYMVKREAKDQVLDVEYIGADTATPAPGVIESIMKANHVIVCPSNPIVSIGTILSIKGVRDALKKSKAKKSAITPIVAGSPVKGPADKLLSGLGLEVSAYSVAKLYADFLNTFIIDKADITEKNRIEELGVEVKITNTLMKDLHSKVELARTVLNIQHFKQFKEPR